jgi:rhodanese-related sulfurtransferase
MTRTLFEMIATARDAVHEISPADAAPALEAGEFEILADVREPAEYRELHVSGAVCIPREVLELRADPASPSADAALTGNRSGRILLYRMKAPGARSLLAGETLAGDGLRPRRGAGGRVIGVVGCRPASRGRRTPAGRVRP